MAVARYLQNVKEDPRVTPGALNAVQQVESGGNPNAVSPKGAVGAYQFMPGTASDLGIDPFNPTQAREGAKKYLSYLIGETGNLPDALAAYNFGLGNWKKKGGSNLPKETTDYVKKVMALLEKHGEPVTVAEAPANPQDLTPKEDAGVETQPKNDSNPTPTSVPTIGGGASRGLPRMAGYGSIEAPPSQFMGRNNPIAMVESLLKDPTALSRGMAEGGAVISNAPQNKFLGALSRALKNIDEFTQPAADIPVAGMLVPRFDSLGNVLEEASYGMPLTTGSGTTTGIKPDVGFAAMDAYQIPGIVGIGRSLAKGAAKKFVRPVERDAIESMFGPQKEWEQSKAAWDAAHGYAGGGVVKGALGRIARMMGADELPNAVRPLEAVKEQGGQWLPGSSQEFIKGIITRRMQEQPDVAEWAQKAVPKYIERYMGAKGDPLAGVQVPHNTPQRQSIVNWESLTDPIISNKPVSEITQNSMYESIPEWMRKLPEETPIYHTNMSGTDMYIRRSAKDYISHALDYAATLPPEKLKNYDFPRLVQEVQKVDADRAKKMATVEGRAEGTTKFKEYPTGFHWAEVQSPEALKREGDIMGHCVGSYCEAVKSGQKKIYSLRDPKGESHATVEVAPSKVTTDDWRNTLSPSELEGSFSQLSGYGNSLEEMKNIFPEKYKELLAGKVPDIRQIKGKQNLAPKPEYQQYIQDLIRSGNYGEVNDLQNAGLRKASDVFGPTELAALKQRGEEVGQYLSPEEVEKLQATFTPALGIPQMKRGGKVKKACKGGSTFTHKVEYAGGGVVKGALGRIARMIGADELPNAVRPLEAVKEQGGQWLPGSAKSFLESSVGGNTGLEDLRPHEIWAQKAVPKYIERYMGAVGDPLADVAIPHGQGVKRWEELTDPLITGSSAGQLIEEGERGLNPWVVEGAPWIKALPKNTRIHEVYNNQQSAPVKDYISHALDYAATIPPEKLKNYDFPRLVQEVQKVDAERVKKMNSIEARSEGTTKFKEYPTGFHWAEVQSPEALKREGDIMGHCVGGYCEEVKSGQKKIYSLRDPKGESHATVEVLSPKVSKGSELSDEEYSALPSHVKNAYEQQSIQQIKGKQNLAPKPEYQQYIQDLIRSGNYGEVKDLQNAGLRHASDVFGPTELAALKQRGEEVGQYLSPEEIEKLQATFTPNPGIPQMKKGGPVKKSCKGSRNCSCLDCSIKRFAK